MRIFVRVFVLALFAVAPIAGAPPQRAMKPDLSWAFPVPDAVQPTPVDDPPHLPGSAKTYTPAQIDDFFNAPDWFPDEHGSLPAVIEHGNGKEVLACGSCHLMSGLGHPESANLTGLTVKYFMRQLADFKSGARKTPQMPGIANALSQEDAQKAAEWFAALKARSWIRVVETDTVPKTFVNKNRMRLPLPGGGTEPLGNRIIEVPEDPARALSLDPHSGFIAYVPKGSIARGQELVANGVGGNEIGCGTCHGPSLEGLVDTPRLAGISPTYIVRQVIGIQTGTRAGASSKVMKGFVASVKIDELVAIAAYLGSLPQPQ